MFLSLNVLLQFTILNYNLNNTSSSLQLRKVMSLSLHILKQPITVMD